jgi:riboflavin biosynthesis pyrimidine reductase
MTRVGAGTVRAEKLNLGLDDPGARQPLAVIVAGNGPVPIREHLVRDPQSPQEVLLFRPEDFRPEDPHAKNHRKQAHDSVRILPVPAYGDGRVDLRFCLELLRREHGVDRLLVEGGPSLNGALITNHLADELFLTLAPKLMHAHPTQISEPASRGPQDLQLLSFHQQNGEIFLRYAI